MGWNWFIFRNHILAVLLGKLSSRVSVERIIKRFDLLPQALHFSSKSIGRHVVLLTPHCSGVFESQLLRALVAELDEAHIVFANWHSDLVPADPRFFEFFRITTISHDVLQVRKTQTLPFVSVRTVFSFPIVAFH